MSCSLNEAAAAFASSEGAGNTASSTNKSTIMALDPSELPISSLFSSTPTSSSTPPESSAPTSSSEQPGHNISITAVASPATQTVESRSDTSVLTQTVIPVPDSSSTNPRPSTPSPTIPSLTTPLLTTPTTTPLPTTLLLTTLLPTTPSPTIPSPTTPIPSQPTPTSGSTSLGETEVTSVTLSVSTASTSPLFHSSSTSKYSLAIGDSDLSTSLTSPETATSSPTAQATSSDGPSQNIVVIAVPVAIGVVLVLILVMFFCWCNRGRSFPWAFRRKDLSEDPEMSYNGSDAMKHPYGLKITPQEHDMGACSVPDMPTIAPEQAIPDSLRSQSKTDAKILPNSVPGSPSAASLPPSAALPYHKTYQRSDSPTISLPEAIEPLDVTKSPKGLGPAQMPTSPQLKSPAEHHKPTGSQIIDWPLPSVHGAPSPEVDKRNRRPWGAAKDGSFNSSIALSYRPEPSTMIYKDHEDRSAGPSSPMPIFRSVSGKASPGASEADLSRPSPLGDDSTRDCVSTYSVSSQEKGRPSSMLNVSTKRQLNDDGISEMTISSRGTHRNSQLQQQTMDEISAVSSLNESCVQELTISRGSSTTALP